MVKMAVRLDKIRRLTETSIDVLRTIAEEIGIENGRVEYGEIAKRLDIGRSSVKYAVDQMIKDGTVQLVGDELSVRESIIWFEE